MLGSVAEATSKALQVTKRSTARGTLPLSGLETILSSDKQQQFAYFYIGLGAEVDLGRKIKFLNYIMHQEGIL